MRASICFLFFWKYAFFQRGAGFVDLWISLPQLLVLAAHFLQHHVDQFKSAATVLAAVGLADLRRDHGIAAVLDSPKLSVMIDDRLVVLLPKVDLHQVFQALGLPFIQNLRQIVGVDEDIPAEVHAEQQHLEYVHLERVPGYFYLWPPEVPIQNRRRLLLCSLEHPADVIHVGPVRFRGRRPLLEGFLVCENEDFPFVFGDVVRVANHRPRASFSDVDVQRAAGRGQDDVQYLVVGDVVTGKLSVDSHHLLVVVLDGPQVLAQGFEIFDDELRGVCSLRLVLVKPVQQPRRGAFFPSYVST
jgi:hypothetical protein